MSDSEVSAVGANPGTTSRERRFRHQIEAGVSISGRIHFPDDARIDGELKGEVRADSLLLVGRTAVLEATVSARRMVVEGTLVGDVVRSGTVELESTAKVLGAIEARNLIVRAGARFDGGARIGRTGENRPLTPQKTTGPPSPAARRRANG